MEFIGKKHRYNDTTAPKKIRWRMGYRHIASWWPIQERIHLQCRRPGFDPWVRKIPWRREWQPTPVFLPGKSHGQRSLVGYKPRGCKESDTIKCCVWDCYEMRWWNCDENLGLSNVRFDSSAKPVGLQTHTHTHTRRSGPKLLLGSFPSSVVGSSQSSWLSYGTMSS